MVKVRQDAWSHEDDLLLAETVLRHIREGSTQLNAFEEVGDKLNRTSAACGFRWNAEVRKKYDQAVDIAKRQRKEKKRAMAKEQNSSLKSPAVQSIFHTNNVEIKNEEAEDQNEIASSSTNSNPLNLDSVIYYLQSMKQEYQDSSRSKFDIQKYQEENESLKEENRRLEKQLTEKHEQLQTIQEDYQVLIQIMDRARKMVVFEDQDSLSTSSFRMDKNGNLENIAR
ncbi:RsfA family transcriptional regulator [Sediminibacillus massiliensis]|uniref:RsfA family transcriptional regulator n=1 Tax=Sediminibacillus massiliensis TaxID=1926277 RepID=UPI0009885D2D|nr:RsfA family transcriptional regulator [Sediminibacillus massiliensis]